MTGSRYRALDLERFADGNRIGRHRQGDRDNAVLMIPQKRQRLGLSAFDGGAQGVAGDPVHLFRGLTPFVLPRLQVMYHPVRCMAGEIVQVIGHGPRDIAGGIGVQPVQKAQRHQRIKPDIGRPWQTRACAFADKAAHVVIVVFRPTIQPGQGFIRPTVQEGPDVELHRKPLCGGLEKVKRAVAVMVQAMTHRKNSRHRMDETSEIVIGSGRIKRRGHRRFQRVGHIREPVRQLRLDAIGQPVQPFKQPTRG